MKFYQHLQERTKVLTPEDHGLIDLENEVFTKPLWSLSGAMVGFQQYNWRAPKKLQKGMKPPELRYFTYVSSGKLALMGLDTLDRYKPVYVVEGMFEYLTGLSYGLNIVAVLTNNPKHLKEQLSFYDTIALCQNDSAGFKLRNVCKSGIVLPTDLDEMPEEEINEYIS